MKRLQNSLAVRATCHMLHCWRSLSAAAAAAAALACCRRPVNQLGKRRRDHGESLPECLRCLLLLSLLLLRRLLRGSLPDVRGL